MEKQQKKRIKKYTSWVLIAVLTATLAFLPMIAAKEEPETGPQASVLSAEAENREISTNILGGGTLAVRLLGSGQEDEARKVASLSLVMAAGAAIIFSSLCFVFMEPLLCLLGASDHTLGYAKQYLTFVVVLGALPTVLSATMSSMLRNVGFSREAAFGLGLGGLLNVVLDPLLMFVVMPEGYQVVGAALATMLSNCASLIYFVCIYRRVKDSSILAIPRGITRITKKSMQSLLSVGIPAATSVLLFDVTNMFLNRLSASYGDFQLAAMGIVLKVERLPLNIGIGICLGMVPLMAYNFAAGNLERMQAVFAAARRAGLLVALCSVVMYFAFAPQIINAFIDDAETVRYGIQFLKSRCLATPVMFLSFHMVHFMQAVNRGRFSLYLAIIRQLCLNIPILFLMNTLLGVQGVVLTQVVADFFNVVISYVIYHYVQQHYIRKPEEPGGKIGM